MQVSYNRRGTCTEIAEIAGSGIFLALHAYHDRFHVYPASLDELRSKLGWALPDDPFSGRAFIYRVMGEGFVLYSVGPDMKDDGRIHPGQPYWFDRRM
jgi:hypothetical protein